MVLSSVPVRPLAPPGVRVIVRTGRLVLGQIPAEELRDCLPRLVFSEPGQVGNLVDNVFYHVKRTGIGDPPLKAPIALKERHLTAAEFQGLAAVPPELEWFANLRNDQTRRAYRHDVGEFSAFIGLHRPTEIRLVTRAHVIAWRERLEHRALAPASIRRKLSALASLFDYLCEKNAVAHNPVKGVKRPMANANEGTTPALSDTQARALLEAPPSNTLKGKRDRAILATLLYHAVS